MLRSSVLVGSRLLRAANLLLQTKLDGKTIASRVQVLDTQLVQPDRVAQWVEEEAAKRNIAIDARTRERLTQLAMRGKIRAQYRKLRRHDIGIILAYYSPCNFKLPRANLLKVVNQFVAAEYPVVVVEAVMPGADPLTELPPQVIHKQIQASVINTLFLKENLYNIGAELLDKLKLVFIDADLEFSRPDWLIATSDLLEEYDVVQPFSNAVWRDRDNLTHLIDRRCAAYCTINGDHPHGDFYHPGFSWAFRREFFDAIGGWYENHPTGSGDTCFWFALDDRMPRMSAIDYWQNCNNLFATTNTFSAYRNRVLSYQPRLSYLKNNAALHLWHGTREKRQYLSRNIDYLPPLVNNDYPVKRGPNGLMAWLDEKDAVKCLQYFQSREEDG
jgi:hypothetical protein